MAKLAMWRTIGLVAAMAAAAIGCSISRGELKMPAETRKDYMDGGLWFISAKALRLDEYENGGIYSVHLTEKAPKKRWKLETIMPAYPTVYVTKEKDTKDTLLFRVEPVNNDTAWAYYRIRRRPKEDTAIWYAIYPKTEQMDPSKAVAVKPLKGAGLLWYLPVYPSNELTLEHMTRRVAYSLTKNVDTVYFYRSLPSYKRHLERKDVIIRYVRDRRAKNEAQASNKSR